MKNEVIYLTKTGHSKKIAEAVAAALGVQAKDIKTKPALEGVDTLFIVGGIYGGVSDPATLEYAAGLKGDAVKKAALLCSSAGGKAGQDKLRQLLKDNGIEVCADEYICRGNFLVVGLGHPNKEEIAGAAAFAKKIAGAAESE